MRILLDTCVLSEFKNLQPEKKVIHWMDSLDEEDLYISVVTIGEIQHGIERMPSSTRKNELSVWLNKDLIARFGQRILAIDLSTMLIWGALMAQTESRRKRMPVTDGLIAATALKENLVLATRNVSDFSACGVRLINPWD